jgi:phosphatidylglycerol:prolipoprotein diacylglycerol transferase
MFPILINFGPIKIYSAVFFGLIAIIAGGYFIWQKAQDEDLSADTVFDFLIVLLIGAFIGGRIGYVLLHFELFSQDPLILFLTQVSPGISFWGMIVGANLCGFYFAKKKKLSFSKYADVCVLGFTWAQVFIYIGNILSGSFAGKESNLWWGIELANFVGRRYPVQIIAFVYSLILLAVVSKMTKRVHFSGLLILLWLISNSLFLFLIDPFRADSVYLLNNVSVNQLIALVAFLYLALFFTERPAEK